MRLFTAAVLVTTLAIAQAAESMTGNTWIDTSYLGDGGATSSDIQYGSVPMTPVPTSSAPLFITKTYMTEPTPISRNINHTSVVTIHETLPLTTEKSTVYITISTPRFVTLDGTFILTTSITADTVTVTLPSTLLPPGGSGISSFQTTSTTTPPALVVTVYTGTYQPSSGQVITTRTAWPASVTIYRSLINSYRIYTYIGTNVTEWYTWTTTHYTSTTTIGTTTVELAPFPLGPYHWTFTRYRSTVTETHRAWEVTYVTRTPTPTPTVTPIEEPSGGATSPGTVTYAAKCAPTNQLSERGKHGLGVQRLLEWSFFPRFFPLPAVVPNINDAATCCQVCVENEGCAASEWALGGHELYRDKPSCRLFFRNLPTARSDDTDELQEGKGWMCGGGLALGYYADSWTLPGQGSFVQTGCGNLTFVGLLDSTCPPCGVDEID
ncbi:hypothetical protein B0H63DRAFT_445287 [Podospora didyma]|uniref:Apple domain-containing protein n=1 Tax=Podospora didyma TaxID=330526 RepID=A0AAE0P8G9_9PEZI|nr:hypothetical protein B0H63DRAFT_445287 [Podospora didyma]